MSSCACQLTRLPTDCANSINDPTIVCVCVQASECLQVYSKKLTAFQLVACANLSGMPSHTSWNLRAAQCVQVAAPLPRRPNSNWTRLNFKLVRSFARSLMFIGAFIFMQLRANHCPTTHRGAAGPNNNLILNWFFPPTPQRCRFALAPIQRHLACTCSVLQVTSEVQTKDSPDGRFGTELLICSLSLCLTPRSSSRESRALVPQQLKLWSSQRSLYIYETVETLELRFGARQQL